VFHRQEKCMLRYAFTVEDVFQLQTGSIALVGRYPDSSAALNRGSAILVMRSTTHVYATQVQSVEITVPQFIAITIQSPSPHEVLLPSDQVWLIEEDNTLLREVT
jgi:hypothetical protein